jgi:hypothetical protein
MSFAYESAKENKRSIQEKLEVGIVYLKDTTETVKK